ncbi:hypothetical protein C8R43DRAFT_1118309 [Mycena crocata]|nr:hypothetical protein C8R43DRAFT_1118309 [Mycena crocata]
MASQIVCSICGGTPFQKSHLLPDPTQTTQVRNFSRSNTVPLESSPFLSIVSESAAELTRYDAEIERLTKIRDQLASERSALEVFVNGCRSIFAPVRRLPQELMVEIFDLCAPPSARGFSDTDTPAQEMDRLAQQHLLELSQVSCYWHNICRTTPKLWSNVVVDTNLWDQCTVPPEALLARLAFSLERGGSHPLLLQVAGPVESNDFAETSVLELLAMHSQRWWAVSLWFDHDSFHLLAGARGKLSLLEVLNISLDSGGLTNDDIFCSAPRLRKLTIDAEVPTVPNLPWEQIRLLFYSPVGESDLSRQLTLLAQLPLDAQFCWAVVPADVVLVGGIPSIVSDVAVMSLQPIIYGGDEEHAKKVFVSILDALTLPRLLALELKRQYLEPAPLWDHARFLAFAARSSFAQHLTELQIHMLMTDAELLQCLETLPLLTVLTISDGDATDDLIQVTDQLLHRLTWTSDAKTCLAPQLHCFSCTSRFKFSPDVYSNFLTSRLVPGRTHDKALSRCKGTIWEFTYPPTCEPFQARFWWLPSSGEPLPPADFTEIFAQIEQLVRRGELGFHASVHPEVVGQSHVAVANTLNV